MSFGDLFKFQKFQVGKWGDQIKKDPERLFLGAADPFGGKVWGKILGKDYEPMITQMGGSTGQTENEAEAAGIDTGTHKKVDSAAKAISAFYAGKWLSGLGGEGGATAGIADAGTGGAEVGLGGMGTTGGVADAGTLGAEVGVGGMGTTGGSASSPWWQQFTNMQPNMGGQQQQTNSYDEYRRMKLARELRRINSYG